MFFLCFISIDYTVYSDTDNDKNTLGDPLLLSSSLLFSTSLHSVSSRQRCPQAKGLESVAPLVQSVEETPDPIPTTIKGTFPSWINGSFLRNGPGKFEFGTDKYMKNNIKKIITLHAYYVYARESAVIFNQMQKLPHLSLGLLLKSIF